MAPQGKAHKKTIDRFLYAYVCTCVNVWVWQWSYLLAMFHTALQAMQKLIAYLGPFLGGHHHLRLWRWVHDGLAQTLSHFLHPLCTRAHMHIHTTQNNGECERRQRPKKDRGKENRERWEVIGDNWMREGGGAYRWRVCECLGIAWARPTARASTRLTAAELSTRAQPSRKPEHTRGDEKN